MQNNRCAEYFSQREDDEADRMTQNLPLWVRPAHRILVAIILQYACTIDSPPEQDESSG